MRPGTSAELVSSVSGPALADMIQVRTPDGRSVDVEELASDLEFILMDIAKVGSDILHRIMNVKKHGGIRMYAEVYKWFKETSGLGLTEQASSLMNPKPAAKEENIAEAIEVWEEKCNRLARHGKMYDLAEASRVEALKKRVIGKTKKYCELWQAEKCHSKPS